MNHRERPLLSDSESPLRTLRSTTRALAVAALAFLFLATVHLDAAAVPVSQAVEEVRSDIRRATEELNRERERIGRERAALSVEVREAQDAVRALREEWRDLQRATTYRDAERARLRERAEASDRSFRFIQSLLSEYRRAAETRMSVAERQRLLDSLRGIDHALTEDEEAGSTLDALGATLSFIENDWTWSVGPDIFPGRIVDDRGQVRTGTFIQLGPWPYFVSDDTEIAGLAGLDPGGEEPALLPLFRPAQRRAIVRLTEDGRAVVPVDVTGGDAVRLVRAREPILERLRSGGVIMIPILGLGLFCAIIAVARYAALRRMDISIDEPLTRIIENLNNGKAAAAQEEAAALIPPWRDVAEEGIRHAGADPTYLEEVLQDRIIAVAPRVEQYLGALAVCAAAAPLLGLLGTVTGMIHTFQLITIFGTGDARTLSGGISEALITTQFGLLIAIPALLAQAWLSKRARRILAGLEQAAIRLVRDLPTQGKET